MAMIGGDVRMRKPVSPLREDGVVRERILCNVELIYDFYVYSLALKGAKFRKFLFLNRPGQWRRRS